MRNFHNADYDPCAQLLLLDETKAKAEQDMDDDDGS
jgi:hypothetical protein